ncbi:MAG: DUF4214 domain-containing protein [Lachnospiraceae bacterium]|nr:DUF4214 domain-containing protein [Lachnospiraceae bacterium]
MKKSRRMIIMLMLLTFLAVMVSAPVASVHATVNRIGQGVVGTIMIAYTGGNSQVYANMITKADGTKVRYVYSKNYTNSYGSEDTFAALKSVLTPEFAALIPDRVDESRNGAIGFFFCSDPSLAQYVNDNWTSAEYVARNVLTVPKEGTTYSYRCEGDGAGGAINTSATSARQNNNNRFELIKTLVENANRARWEAIENERKASWDAAEAEKKVADPNYVPQEYQRSTYTPLDFGELTSGDLQGIRDVTDSQIDLAVGCTCQVTYKFVSGRLVEATNFSFVDQVATIYSEHAMISESSSNNNKDPQDKEDKKSLGMVYEFVERMYTKALKRASEEAGKNDWANQLLTGKSDGATLARGFICSDEFMNKEMSNEDFLDTLYATFFDRDADEGGKAYWLSELANGRSRTGVLSGFVNSAEFGALCERYGIARGTMEEDGSNIYNEGVYNFVKRNYTKTLGRNGEIAGIEDWCHRINKGELSMKDVAVEFLHSTEFLNKNTTNEEYVTILYHTFMDREPDAAGLSDWVGQLDRGEKTRDEIVSGFADSKEFADIMSQYQ